MFQISGFCTEHAPQKASGFNSLEILFRSRSAIFAKEAKFIQAYRPCFFVLLHVEAEVPVTGEGLGTHGALEVSLSCMGDLVGLEVDLLAEQPAADLAGVALHSCIGERGRKQCLVGLSNGG